MSDFPTPDAPEAPPVEAAPPVVNPTVAEHIEAHDLPQWQAAGVLRLVGPKDEQWHRAMRMSIDEFRAGLNRVLHGRI